MSATKTASPDAAPGELSCVSCGYLLRGHGPGERCPECGAAVRLSIEAQRLGGWPGEWIRRLQLGLRLLSAAVAVGWVATLVFVLFTPSMLWGLNDLFVFVDRWRLGRFQWTLAFPLLIAFALAVGGTVVVTFSEAARIVATERPRAPWLARAGIFAGVIGFAVLAVTLTMARGTFRDRMIWMWLLLLIGGILATWNLCTCLARLARRIPDERLARRCESFRWVALLTAGLFAFEAFNFWTVIAWLPIRSNLTWWRTAAAVDALIVTGRVALLVAGVLALGLLRAYGRGLAGLR